MAKPDVTFHGNVSRSHNVSRKVIFRGNVSAIMFNFYKEEKMQDSKSEAMRIIGQLQN